MVSTAQTTPRDSEIINELLSGVTHGFDSPNSPRDSDIINKTAATGDAWIQQRKQPLETHKTSTNFFHGWCMDSTAQTAPRDSDILNEIAATGDA